MRRLATTPSHFGFEGTLQFLGILYHVNLFYTTLKTSFCRVGKSAETKSLTLLSLPVLLFSKLNKMFFGYFDPQNIFLDNKIK